MKLKQMFQFLFQLFILLIINELGYFLASLLSLSLPGNVLGMIILFLLLLTGVLKLEWIEDASSFLLKHLVFFFIPITVGVMTLGPIILKHGLSIFIILITSAAIGMMSTGQLAQLFLRKRDVS